MKIVRDIESLRQAIRSLRQDGKRIALVPTMGALHNGHISLVKQGMQRGCEVVASIFVNPTQFGPNEDFARYPRTEEADLAALAQAGNAIAYLPRVEEIYPPEAATRVQVLPLSTELCGAFRPGHFDGVATIVTKLFLQALPDIAIFWEKDYQQLTIIRRFTADLDIPVEVIGAPILREEDGLAMSSRNRYLTSQQRAIAPAMYRVLTSLSDEVKKPGIELETVLGKGRAALLAAGFTSVDYVELRAAATLARIEKLDVPARLLAAAHIGTTRLIDNVEV